MLTPRPLNLLLVEDNDDHAYVIERSLSRLPAIASIFRTADGPEALSLLLGQDQPPDWEQPDLILLDLNLPKVSGHDVLHRIKDDAQTQGIPVVILTTSDAEADRARAMVSHANSYVVKPIDLQCFQQVLRDLSHYWWSVDSGHAA